MNRRVFVCCGVVTMLCAFSVGKAQSHGWWSIGGGVLLRDTRDYDAANPVGGEGTFAIEMRSGAKGAIRFDLTGAAFSDRLNVVPAANRVTPTPGRVGNFVPAARFSWDPNLTGHSYLTSWSLGAEYRRYLMSVENGLFVGGGAGLVHLQAKNQTAGPPFLSGSVGYVAMLIPNLRTSFETGIRVRSLNSVAVLL